MLMSVYRWLDQRLHITDLFASTAGHHVPANSGSWWYVFGSATLLCFILQIFTGSLLALVYVPSTNEAWTSLQYLNHVQYLGWYLRALHNWGSNFMVALMTLHLVQVFLFGAYKYPRELTWISGIFLMICTMAMAFTGQVMRFDQDAYWGLGIGASITGRVPLIGDRLVHLLLGGPIIAGETLSRFFTLHVFILPGTILGIVAMHLRLVLSRGINEYPEPGRLVRKSTYDEYYEKLVAETGVPFVPDAIGKDLIFSALTIVALLVCSAVFGPAGPAGVPDPTLVNTVPRPDFYFLSVFAMFALLPDWMETIVLFVMPAVVLGFLIILPFIAGTGEKSYRRRPIAVLTVLLVAVVLGTLTYLGETSPWSPKMSAWTAESIPPDLLKGRTPVEMRGATVLQNKQCRNCHSLGGRGGQRGPALDDVATRLTRDQLVRQVIQGGGNMPAYGKNLNPAEVESLISFLATLKPSYQLPARDSSTPSSPSNKGGSGRTRGGISGG
jgi:ubiquinol-cytochrome c reductase cytochrome b subunit